MEKIEVSYADNTDRLKALVNIEKSGKRSHEVGTAFLPSGCSMPDFGSSIHPKHEVSIILEGKLETTSGGKTVILRKGDIVSIPEGESQSSKVLEDTKLIYIFFDK
jgi:quercetin dioxygenase-like cupin family protein